jgi:mandelate racemase
MLRATSAPTLDLAVHHKLTVRELIRTAVGTILSAPLVLIDLTTEEGINGRSYIFAYTPAVLGALVRLVEELSAELRGKPVVPVDRMRDFDRRFRLLGWQGLVGMIVSGVDMAFWDALARAKGEAVVALLGGSSAPIPAYDSYGIVDVSKDEPDILASLESGFRGLKIKLGAGSLENDRSTVAALRATIGPDIALMVDYNQSLDPVEARRRIAGLAEFDLYWVEEPVPAEDLRGHAQVRASSPVPIQTGENWWFPSGMANAVAAGASDYAMLDIMKIGGVTGWTRAMGLAQGVSLPVSSHLFIEASAHMLAITPTAHWIEHLDVAGAILAEPYRSVDGTLSARGPGFGMAWDEAAVQRYLA